MNKAIRFFCVAAAVTMICGCGHDTYPNTKVVIDEVYSLQGSDNIRFVFSKDSTLVVRQKGLYDLTENSKGEPVLRICLDDISRELPEDYSYTEYRIEDEGRYLSLTLTTDDYELDESPMLLFPLKGTDGLLSGARFEGSYQIGRADDSYQYIFKEDGQVTMQVKQHYYADGKDMTLSDHAGSTDYIYEMSEDSLVLKNTQEEPALTLVKVEK